MAKKLWWLPQLLIAAVVLSSIALPLAPMPVSAQTSLPLATPEEVELSPLPAQPPFEEVGAAEAIPTAPPDGEVGAAWYCNWLDLIGQNFLSADVQGQYNASASDRIGLYWGDGAIEELFDKGLQTFTRSHVYLQDGTYNITLIVYTSDFKYSDRCDVWITVRGPTPTPTHTPTVTPTFTPSATPTNTPSATPTATFTPSPTATNTPTVTPSPTASPTNTPTATPTFTPSPTPTATATKLPCVEYPNQEECKVYLPWSGGNVLTSATVLLNDPLSCKNYWWLTQGELVTTRGFLRPEQDSCENPQLIRIPKSYMVWEDGLLRTYVLAAQGDWGACYLGVTYTRVVNPGEEHIDKLGCLFVTGEIVRVKNLGHDFYGVDPGDVTVDTGPGTTPIPFGEFGGFSTNSATISPVKYYMPGTDYVGKHPAQAISIMIGNYLEIVGAQDRSPDPGRISGRIRAHAWSNANLNFEGLLGYGLRSELAPDDISHLIVGSVSGYPPEGVAAAETKIIWDTSNVPPIIQELFSDDWE